MNYLRAKSKAKKMSKIINDNCYIIKIKTPVRWYLPNSWFRFENVSQAYIDYMSYKGKLYFKTK